MSLTLRLLVLLSALVAADAHAAALRVHYVVEEKPLKQAVVGTELTYSFYSDAACSALVTTRTVAIESVSALSRPKPFRPKGAPKPPKTVEIEHTLDVTTTATQLYVVLSGTGVVPIGNPCQVALAAQSSAWHWIVVQTPTNFWAYSPSLAGTTVVRPVAAPIGVYCVTFPVGSGASTEGVIGSLQKSSSGVFDRVIVVTTSYGTECETEGLGDFQVNIYDFNGTSFVPTEASFTLLAPGLPEVMD